MLMAVRDLRPQIRRLHEGSFQYDRPAQPRPLVDRSRADPVADAPGQLADHDANEHAGHGRDATDDADPVRDGGYVEGSAGGSPEGPRGRRLQDQRLQVHGRHGHLQTDLHAADGDDDERRDEIQRHRRLHRHDDDGRERPEDDDGVRRQANGRMSGEIDGKLLNFRF